MTVLGSIIRPAAGCAADANNECVTASWFMPDPAELIWGGLAFLVILALLIKLALPAAKKGLAARTERIQAQLDAAAAAKSAATTEAQQIRQAKGDIAAERARLLADADAQAATILAEGRVRLAEELAALEARAEADIAATRNRGSDELRAEIAGLSSAAVDHVVRGSLDDATHQRLIEDFISRVGARS